MPADFSIHTTPNDSGSKKRKEDPNLNYTSYPECGISTHYGTATFKDCQFPGSIILDSDVTAGKNGTFGGFVQSAQYVQAPIIRGDVVQDTGGNILANKKNLPFDMVHPTKPGWRLRHVCLEGPEIGVYLHGKGKGKVIELPDYWRGLVKEETISVVLTPIGYPYVLFIDKIEDNKVYVGSSLSLGGGEVEYNYVIHASRYDDDLIVEYEGESHLDYPGGNEGYSFNYEHNYVQNLIKETIRECLDKK